MPASPYPLVGPKKDRGADRVSLEAAGGRERATISVLDFKVPPSFEDFKRLCEHRIGAEKKASPDAFVQPSDPWDSQGSFKFLYSGGEKASGRVFSGHLSLKDRQLVTLYVEGIGVVAKAHLGSFEAFMKGFQRVS
jgi:hypothetical protein